MTIKLSTLFSTILVLIVSFPGQISAGTAEAKDYIDYRKTLMRSIDKHFDAIPPIIKYNLPVKEHIIVHAEAIYGMSKSFESLYPEGSGKSVKNKYWTKVKPTVWTDPELFSAYLLSQQELSLLLIDAAERDDMSEVKVIHKHMQTICKTCHYRFKNFKSGIVFEDE